MAALTTFTPAYGLIISLSICLVILPIRSSYAQNLKSLISISQHLSGKLNITYGGNNINIIEVGNSEPLYLCYFPWLASFSFGGQVFESWGYYGLAAILLALEHLNTGNGTIVPEIDGINQRCPLRFYTNSFDAKAEEGK